MIIPAYNVGQYIGEAIESVLTQTYPDTEIIVVDDGSTDDTSNAVKPYHGRVRYVRQENSGPARARNRGIQEASGLYVAFLDGDDTWRPDKLERQVALMGKYAEVALSFTDADEVYDGEVVTPSLLSTKPLLPGMVGARGSAVPISGESAYTSLLRSCFILTSTALLRRSVLSEVGDFNKSFDPCEDRDLWLRIAERHDIGCLNEVLTTHRLHDRNISNQKSNVLTARIAIFEGLLAREGNPGRRQILREELSEVTFKLGRLQFHAGRYKDAARQFRRSREVGVYHWKLFPFSVLSWLLRSRQRGD